MTDTGGPLEPLSSLRGLVVSDPVSELSLVFHLVDLARLAGDHAAYMWTYEGTNTGPGGTGHVVRLAGLGPLSVAGQTTNGLWAES